MASELARLLTAKQAVVIGLGSMLGAGVFTAFAPAAAVAGWALPLSLVLAAAVAFANGTASAQLAARYPKAGGSYIYGREKLGTWPGFFAGWAFTIGKTASLAAMGLVAATYLHPSNPRPVALGILAFATIIACLGITRTARATAVTVAIVLLVLGCVFLTAFELPAAYPFWSHVTELAATADGTTVRGMAQGAALLFFAFAGYARIATMGEEIRDPASSIPAATHQSIGLVAVIYAVITYLLLTRLGPEATAATDMPIASLVDLTRFDRIGIVLSATAALAATGALLALIVGISRTLLAMSRHGDLPAFFARTSRRQVPALATVVVAGVVAALMVFLPSITTAIGFSSFGVLLYYAIANASALRQPAAERRYPRVLHIFGLLACLGLVASLPVTSIVIGAGVVVVGLIYRLVWLGLMTHRKPPRVETMEPEPGKDTQDE
ncbi:APC family permease [Bowdeniella massiliensis]|uniref:APC family permease n=1 Tax=Bowdeniella massiliensis TaxID=2932264 RepID=UPI002028F9C4|nr:APC family permease [Bowdeniella massiliensis]